MTFAYFGSNLNSYTVLLQIFRSTVGCNNSVAQLFKAASNSNCLRLIHISNGNQNCTLVRYIDTGSDAGLIQRTAILVVAGHNLTGGFHFRSKGDIYIAHLIEAEYRSFNSIVVREEA